MKYSREAIAKNLQRLRREAGYKSAKAFAASIGMNSSTYTNFEQGVRPLSLVRACELADALHVTVDELAGRASAAGRDQQRIPDILSRAYEESNEAGRYILESNARMLLGSPEFQAAGDMPGLRADETA